MNIVSRVAGRAILAAMLFSAGVAHAREKTTFIDIEPLANRKLHDNLGSGAEDNSLSQLPTGEQVLGGVKFKVGPGLIQLGSTLVDSYPEKAEGLLVNRRFNTLHVLHATCFGRGMNEDEWYVKDGTLIGQYVLHYEDGSSEGISIVYGEDVRDWWYSEGEQEPSRGKVVWKGENGVATERGAHLRLYTSTWKNPKPDKKVLRIDYVSRKNETPAAPFCVSMTIEEN